MSVRIVLVGGAQDGREIETVEPLLPLYRLPRRGGFLSLAEQTGPPSSLLEVDEYAILLGPPSPVGRGPSRDDLGRIRFGYVRSDS